MTERIDAGRYRTWDAEGAEEDRWLRAERLSRARTEGELEIAAQAIVHDLSNAGLMVWQAQEILKMAQELLLWQCLGGQ